jgi:uncharacterized protein (DUF433 family)
MTFDHIRQGEKLFINANILYTIKMNFLGIHTMDTQLIQSNPAIMMGKPVVAGTRITVEFILEKLAAGETIEQVLEAHPRLTKEAVLAALDFAARALRSDVIYPLSRKAA